MSIISLFITVAPLQQYKYRKDSDWNQIKSKLFVIFIYILIFTAHLATFLRFIISICVYCSKIISMSHYTDNHPEPGRAPKELPDISNVRGSSGEWIIEEDTEGSGDSNHDPIFYEVTINKPQSLEGFLKLIFDE